ncbi:MAG TPA: methyltransferase domain-containing protein [Thermoplasmata archaeon]|nr:methyltransferase domain-containing protein [Thermoplasmata archaeon]
MALGIRTVEWWSVRKRLADLAVLREIVTPGPGMRLLDLGGGAGAATERFATGCAEIVILEPNAKKVAFGRRRRPAIHFFEGRAHAIPYPDGTFDRVTAVVSFHHMEDPERVLTEVHRVLRAGGRFVLVEFPPSEAPGTLFHWFTARRGEHLSFSNPDELAQKVEAHGLRDVSIRRGNNGFFVVGTR